MRSSVRNEAQPRRISRMPVLLLTLVLAAALTGSLGACGSDDDEVGTGPSGTGPGDTEPTAITPDDTTPAALPGREPDLIGTITVVTPFEPVTDNCTPPEDLDPDGAVSSDDPPVCTDPDTDVVGTILVEASAGAAPGALGDKASLTVTTATAIGVCGPTDARVPGSFEDATVGQEVYVWVDGPVAESYPVQATANALGVGTCG